jgi:L-2-hydroxyglutarate oxidase LhgO
MTGRKPMEKLDCVVIGAGVIGLAAARALAREGREVFILESTEGIGNEASSRNSEVIHAGMYYPTGSLKAKLCVEGRDRLYRYCEQRDIRHGRIGKLIVATDGSEIPKLEQIEDQARINGVDDLQLLDRAEVQSLEPDLTCEAALFSPSTGIIDSHGLMECLLADAEDRGAIIALGSPVNGGVIRSDGIVLEVGGAEPMTVLCRTVVNCTGIHAAEGARSMEGFPCETLPGIYMCKGNYFSLSGKAFFSHLIYPLPDEAGLGIHLTLDLAGKARFGPDTEWVEKIDYLIDENRAEIFYEAVRRYWPDLPDGSLHPDYSGIRAKLSGPGEEARDFLIQGPDDHGVSGLVNMLGIDSPGLTACMAIADEVVKRLT